MKSVAASNNTPSMLIDDFNRILSMEPKASNCHQFLGIDSFRDTIDACGLIDIIPTGTWFTWSNNRQGDKVAWEGLDRVLISSDWFIEYSDMSIESQAIVPSDHSPLIVHLFNAIPRR